MLRIKEHEVLYEDTLPERKVLFGMLERVMLPGLLERMMLAGLFERMMLPGLLERMVLPELLERRMHPGSPAASGAARPAPATGINKSKHLQYLPNPAPGPATQPKAALLALKNPALRLEVCHHEGSGSSRA